MSRSMRHALGRATTRPTRRSRAGKVVLAVVLAVLAGVVPSFVAATSALADYVPATKASWVPNAGVDAVAVSGPYLYLGGQFTSLTNRATGEVVRRTRLARVVLSTGQLDRTWAPTASEDVLAFAVSEDGGQLFVGGRFTSVSGVPRERVAAVSTSGVGALDSGWAGAANGTVKAMFVENGRLYLTGGFTALDGVARRFVGAVSVSSGALDPGFRPDVSAFTDAAMPSLDGRRVLIGGEFTWVGGRPRSYLASVDAVTGAVTEWDPAPACPVPDVSDPCAVLDLVPKASAVYAAEAGPGGRLVAYDAVTGAVRWNVYADGDVQTVAVDDRWVYAGGHFDPHFGPATRALLAAVDQATGTVNPSFAPVLSTPYPGVKDLVATPGFLVAAGEFTDANGSGQSYVAVYPRVPDVTTPSTPRGLTAVMTTAEGATLTWNAATDDVGVAGYQVVRNGVVLTGTVTGTGYTDAGLRPSATYTYAVRAVDAAGNVSGDSESIAVTTLARSAELFLASGTQGAGSGRAFSAAEGGPFVSFALSGAAESSRAVLGETFGWESAYRLMAGYGVELTHA